MDSVLINHICYSNIPSICSNTLFKESFHVLDSIPGEVSILTKTDKIPSPHGTFWLRWETNPPSGKIVMIIPEQLKLGCGWVQPWGKALLYVGSWEKPHRENAG